jgi:serine/threonine protein kinase
MGLEDTTIGNYHILSLIAYGSFGRVYLARHTTVANHTVALKLMHTVPLSSSEEREQFLHEAKILELLRHPFILPILDVGIHEGSPYIASEYADGGSLRQHLKKRGEQPYEFEEALTILAQISQGLQYAHQKNIIHRDIKPENILFNGKGEALLADFGLATMLATASVKYVTNAGTPRYMAPEQYQGRISKETDQYALGCIAYELLTGHAPFEGTDPVSLMYQHVHVMPTSLTKHNPQLSPSTNQIILKTLSKQRQDRYADVESFITALSNSNSSPAFSTYATIADPPSAEQETIATSYATDPLNDIFLPPEASEHGGMGIEAGIPFDAHTQRGEKLSTTIINQAKQSTTTAASEDHPTLPIQHKQMQVGTKSLRQTYTIAATFLMLALILSSSFWAWQITHSAKTATLTPPSTTIPRLSIISSPTSAPTPTPTPTPPTATHATTALIRSIPTPTPAPPTPTPTPIPPPPTPVLPTPTATYSTATPTSTQLLMANPGDLSYVTSQCLHNNGYSCSVILSLSSAAQGSIYWSSTNAIKGCNITCNVSTNNVITISPSSGNLNAGNSVEVYISSPTCYPESFTGSIIFSGPANTITVPFTCYDGPG